MSEAASIRSTILVKLKELPRCTLDRIENAINRGIPDIQACWAGTEVWIECKFLHALPKRAATGLRVPFEPEQCAWAERRSRAGSIVRCVLRIQNQGWYVFDHRLTPFVDLKNGRWTVVELRGLAVWHGPVFAATAVFFQDGVHRG